MRTRYNWVLILASCGTCKLFVYDNSVEFDESHCLCLVVGEVCLVLYANVPHFPGKPEFSFLIIELFEI